MLRPENKIQQKPINKVLFQNLQVQCNTPQWNRLELKLKH